jgi:hypothetical protein
MTSVEPLTSLVHTESYLKNFRNKTVRLTGPAGDTVSLKKSLFYQLLLIVCFLLVALTFFIILFSVYYQKISIGK